MDPEGAPSGTSDESRPQPAQRDRPIPDQDHARSTLNATSQEPPACPAWDSFDAYLFDIDGTLLNCRDAVHYFAFCDTLSWVAGRPIDLDGVHTHGNTDVGILADALRLAAIPETHWRPLLPEIQERMARSVLYNEPDIRPEVLPGVPQVLAHLHSRGAHLGLATGNLEAIGWAKLRRAGLAQFFSFGGFSNHAHTRPEIFAAAARQARDMLGLDATLCVVGDTPADITAAQANLLPVIAAATGIYRTADLHQHNPTWCVPNLLWLPKRESG